MGLEKPSEGKISIFRENKSLSNKEVKKIISLVPQDTAFFKDFSVEKNIAFFGSLYGVKGKKGKERVNFLLKWLGLEEFKNTKSDFLSGGYQRLLNIAISLVHDPEIIFLDEPTVGLDPKMRQLFRNKIEELKSLGKTIIITTHYMDEAEHLCSRVALLKKGKLLALGIPRELIKQHGGIKVVIFEIKGELDPKDLEFIRKSLRLESVVFNKGMLFIPFEQEKSVEKVTFVAEWLLGRGYSVLSSTTKEPNLEDVFLQLTGESSKSSE